jgi:hypothetical protein
VLGGNLVYTVILYCYTQWDGKHKKQQLIIRGSQCAKRIINCSEKKKDIWTDYETNTQIAKELKITPILDKLLEYKRNWIQNVNRMPRNRLPSVMKHYSPTGRRNHGRPLKRLLDT